MAPLEKQKNFPLANITFKQPFNKKKVLELLQSDKISTDDRGLLKWLAKLKESVAETKLKVPKSSWGRYIIPMTSIFKLSRKSRHYVCGEDYYDFDIVNSQPTVMLSYFKSVGLQNTNQLEKYVLNRNESLEQIMNEFQFDEGEYDGYHCSRKDISKKLFTSICNLGSFHSWISKYNVSYGETANVQYFKKLSEEMKSNIELVKKIEVELWNDVKKMKKDDPHAYLEATFSSYLYQELERRIIESFLNNQDIESIYSLDGVMIPKKVMDDNSVEEFCKAFQNRMIDVFGEHYYLLKMISKPMDEAWVIEKTSVEVVDEYENMKLEFEKNNSHFYLINQKKYFRKIMNDNGTCYYVPHSASEFMNALAYLRLTVNSKKGTSTISFISEWFKDETRLTFNDFTYDLKMNPDPKYLNLWTGFDILHVQPLEEKKHQRLFGHWNKYLDILSNNDPIVKNYLEHWTAQIVQRPWSPNTVSLLLQANGQGGGKTSFGVSIAAILGNKKYYQTGQGFSRLFPEDGFNEHLQDCFIYLADELEGDDSRKNNSKFKQFLTAEKLSINGKGKPSFEIPNKINLISTSNGLNPMPVGEKERRLLIIQISDDWINNKEAWEYHYDMIVNRPEACRTLFDYYNDSTRFNLNTWNAKEIPQTKLTEILRDASRDPLEEILLEDMVFLEKMIEEPSNSIEILQKVNRGLEKRMLKPMNAVSLGIKLAKNTFCSKIFEVKHTKKGRIYSVIKSALEELLSCQIKDIDEQLENLPKE